METLQETLKRGDRYLYGFELVSTRGSMEAQKAIAARSFSQALSHYDAIDWISITDNAGGNPMLAPAALGRPILYAGKEVIIHLACKDFNRNGLESEAWHLASEGFHNILTLSGDAPVAGSGGVAKGVFDIDSVGLLSMLDQMNKGAMVTHAAGKGGDLAPTQFFSGAVVTNFKRYENEVVPQYLKLKKKIACGAAFIINQIGFDARKMHELIGYMQQENLGHVPLIGNVYVLSGFTSRLFHSGKIPGVSVNETLLALCQKQCKSDDKGKAFFLELAAKQSAIYKGLGYRGSYLGGLHRMVDVERFFEIENSFSPDDWKGFVKELNFHETDEFYLYEQNLSSGLSLPGQLSQQYLDAIAKPKKHLGYQVSKLAHDLLFTPNGTAAKVGGALCSNAKDNMQGPKLLRLAEHASKKVLFNCQDCGDCSLPDIAFLCPESQCAKNQRNGPCGGTREGLCEVADKECIWGRAYDRLKSSQGHMALLDHVPVIQDQGLRGTSSWANTWLGRDHHGNAGQKVNKNNVNQNKKNDKEVVL